MIVAGHSECGAIKAATSDFAAEPLALVNELTIVKKSLDQACTGIKVDLATHSPTQVQLSELNVDAQIDLLLENAEVALLVEKQALQIIGVMVDLHNFYGEGYGKIYTVNVNGEKNVEVIKKIDKIGVFASKARRLNN